MKSFRGLILVLTICLTGILRPISAFALGELVPTPLTGTLSAEQIRNYNVLMAEFRRRESRVDQPLIANGKVIFSTSESNPEIHGLPKIPIR